MLRMKATAAAMSATSSSWLPIRKGPLRSLRLRMAQAWSKRKEDSPASASSAATSGNWHISLLAT